MPTLIVLSNYLPVPVGAKYFTTKDDSVAMNIEEAKSFGFFDQVVSRKRNYRNTLSAGEIGRAWQSLLASPPAVFMEQSDDRVEPAVEPRNETCTATFMAFMTGVDGTGTCVALIEAELFEHFSADIPQRY